MIHVYATVLSDIDALFFLIQYVYLLSCLNAFDVVLMIFLDAYFFFMSLSS